MSRRYALYWAPRPDEPLARMAAEWLGRDAEAGIVVPQPPIPEIARLTAEPRRYGFHATLKSPFRLAPGADEAMLLGAVEALAADVAPFGSPAPRLAAIGRFLALVPSEACAALDELAARCVEEFDPFRAPPAPAELERRCRAGLTARQEALLLRWGYPYVFEEFRFHLTLTGMLSPDERAALEPVLRERMAGCADAPLRIADLVVFIEPAPGAPFSVLARFPLRGI